MLFIYIIPPIIVMIIVSIRIIRKATKHDWSGIRWIQEKVKKEYTGYDAQRADYPIIRRYIHAEVNASPGVGRD